MNWRDTILANIRLEAIRAKVCAGASIEARELAGSLDDDQADLFESGLRTHEGEKNAQG